ncbi:alpha/beta fold hydrolase [Tsukamurella soli]|uniref:Poly(3-hydroxyalkanoate) depolymerase n=1 Tax=Tsukamurella soli TaxID=644556 RepID=A0ABP8JFL6_9ACTN
MTGNNELETSEELIATGGQRLRVRYRRGIGVPLLMCNGIGAGLELLSPVVEQLDPNRPVVRFDAPGAGGSPGSPVPYSFPYLAWVLGRVLDRLGIGVVDVLGLSWGGAVAQQFAFQNPHRCRRVVLVATGTGALMVPGKPAVLAKMLTPRRFRDPDHAAGVSEELYGGSVRGRGADVAALMGRQMHTGSARGYTHQLVAGTIWTSLFALPVIRQNTLVVAGLDDPIIPPVNARVMSRLLPRGRVYWHRGGHIDLILNAREVVPYIEDFLGAPGRRIGTRTANG